MALALDRLLLVDTGLLRTVTAARATLAVVLAAGLLLPAAVAAGEPPIAAMMGAVVGLLGVLLVDEPNRIGVVRTSLLIGVGASGAVALGGLLGDHRLVAYTAFVIIMAVATWARRFGSRGFAIGTTTFVAYLVVLFLEATLPMVPDLVGGVIVGVVVVAVVRGLLLPDRPSALSRTLRTLQLRGARLLGPEIPDDPLEDVVLQARELLDGAAGPVVLGERETARAHLLRIAVIADHLTAPHARVGRMARAAPERRRVQATLANELAALDALARSSEPPRADSEFTDEHVGRSPTGTRHTTSMAPETRASLQVAVAGALAVALGVLLSAERWYWAVIAAFVVFANTASRGAILRKAAERVVGTVVGILAGFLVAVALADTAVSLAVGVALVFVAMWVLQVSYPLMILAITIVLVLLYDVLGMLTAEVLVLRLAETAVGAGVGVLVAMLVLPVRTRDHVDACAALVLGTVIEVLEALDRSDASRQDILAAVDHLDASHDELRVAVAPWRGLSLASRASDPRPQHLVVSAIRYWTRRLAWTAIRDGSRPSGPVSVVVGQVRHVRDALVEGQPPKVQAIHEDVGDLEELVESLGGFTHLLQGRRPSEHRPLPDLMENGRPLDFEDRQQA